MIEETIEQYKQGRLSELEYLNELKQHESLVEGAQFPTYPAS